MPPPRVAGAACPIGCVRLRARELFYDLNLEVRKIFQLQTCVVLKIHQTKFGVLKNIRELRKARTSMR